jgi:hypothetical protein
MVGRLDLVNLDATVSTPSSLRIAVNGLTASLQGDAQGRLSGDLRAERGIRVDASGGAETLDRVTAHVTIGSDALVIQSLVAGSSSGELRLDGAVGFARERQLRPANTGSTIDVSERASGGTVPSRSWQGRGIWIYHWRARGPSPDLRCQGARRFHRRPGRTGGLTQPATCPFDSIEVETVALRSLDGAFNGRGRIAFRDGGERSMVEASGACHDCAHWPRSSTS